MTFTDISHDFYGHIIRKGGATETEQVKAARIASVAVALVSMGLAFFAQSMNVAFLVSLAFAVAASANISVILFTIFWRRFNTGGGISGMVAFLFSSLILVALSPNLWAPDDGSAIFLGEALFPLSKPGIVSIPLGFIAAVIGTLLTKSDEVAGNYERVLVKANTGIDAETEVAATKAD